MSRRREDLTRRHQFYQLAFAASVGLLALDALGIAEVGDTERQAVREAVTDERDRLSRPARTLFDVLDGADVDHAGFDADVDPRDIRATLGELEEAAYARLLNRLDASDS